MCEYILKLRMTKTNYSLSSYYFTLNSWQCTATHNQGWECTKIKKKAVPPPELSAEGCSCLYRKSAALYSVEWRNVDGRPICS